MQRERCPLGIKKLLSLAPDSRFDICKRTFLLIAGVYILFENSYTFHNFSLNLPPTKKKFLPSGQPVHIGGYSSIFVNWGGRKDKEFLVIFRKNKGILSACGQKFHWKLQFYINSYHNFVNISSNPTSKPYTFHNSFLIPSTQKFFIGDLRSPIFHKIYSPGPFL